MSRRAITSLLRDLEVAKLGVMCAKEPAERERWMARVDELRAEIAKRSPEAQAVLGRTEVPPARAV